MIKQSINESQFITEFNQMRPDNFSYDGLKALYEYLDQLSEDIGEDIELDIIALCCEYTEYESLQAFQDDYGDTYKSIEDIEDRTQVIKIDDDKFIIQNF